MSLEDKLVTSLNHLSSFTFLGQCKYSTRYPGQLKKVVTRIQLNNPNCLNFYEQSKLPLKVATTAILLRNGPRLKTSDHLLLQHLSIFFLLTSAYLLVYFLVSLLYIIYSSTYLIAYIFYSKLHWQFHRRSPRVQAIFYNQFLRSHLPYHICC